MLTSNNISLISNSRVACKRHQNGGDGLRSCLHGCSVAPCCYVIYKEAAAATAEKKHWAGGAKSYITQGWWHNIYYLKSKTTAAVLNEARLKAATECSRFAASLSQKRNEANTRFANRATRTDLCPSGREEPVQQLRFRLFPMVQGHPELGLLETLP